MLVLVPFIGLDGLSRDLRKQIDAERSAYTDAQGKFRSAQKDILGNLQSEKELFDRVPESAQWPQQLTAAEGTLQSAGQEIDQLTQLEKSNRKRDADRVKELLTDERANRTSATAKIDQIHDRAAHWVQMKRDLPATLSRMEQDYHTIRDFDFNPIAGEVQRAATDWPEKRDDLEKHLSLLKNYATQADILWNTTADSRTAAAKGDLARVDFGTLLSAADRLRTAAQDLPKQSDGLKSLTAQLYDSWDKILVDMETRDGEYRQQVRTVRTHFDSAAAKNGQTTSDDKWQLVARTTYDAQKRDLGMSIEHKSPGKYDIEAERTPQPAGFAYMAQPGSSNQYGYWENRGGQSFWVWYGQYALLRDLLFNRDYRPLDRYEWEEYRRYRSQGSTYYGNDNGAPKYGSQGSATQEHYSGSTFAKKGGFKDSQYASRPGGFRDSKYSSPATEPKRFGSGSSSSSSPRSSPSVSSRPSSRPSSPSRSSGRTFGSGRRR
jgi:hypothetical protein